MNTRNRNSVRRVVAAMLMGAALVTLSMSVQQYLHAPFPDMTDSAKAMNVSATQIDRFAGSGTY